MPRVFVGNFDFEHELANGRTDQSSHVRDIAAGLAASWIAIAELDDVIWTPDGVPDHDLRAFSVLAGFEPRFIQRERDLPHGSDWELVPWGWTSSVLNWGLKFGWSCPAPPLDIVKLVNSRAFRFLLETRLKVALPRSTVITTTEQLTVDVQQFAEDHSEPAAAGWVLKANFGMSGRERQLGRGPQLTIPTLNWATRRLRQSSVLIFEPWLDRVAEAGIQLAIPRHGNPTLLGILPLLTDSTGTYRGSRIQSPTTELECWKPTAETALEVARQVQSAGYFGPLGIDAMQYRDRHGELQIRHLQDLNARYTMGRLGLGLRRFIGKSSQADWLHDAGLLAKAQNPATRIVPITARSWLVEGL